MKSSPGLDEDEMEYLLDDMEDLAGAGVEKTFDLMDSDGNGTIDISELKSFLADGRLAELAAGTSIA